MQKLVICELGAVNGFGFPNYLTRQFSDKLSGTTRLEFFDDAPGQRADFAGLYTALTASLKYRLRKDVSMRPEVRYDYNGESASFQD
jgi:Putative beta-barrel porin-2, OmpL-like. bbp2